MASSSGSATTAPRAATRASARSARWRWSMAQLCRGCVTLSP